MSHVKQPLIKLTPFTLRQAQRERSQVFAVGTELVEVFIQNFLKCKRISLLVSVALFSCTAYAVELTNPEPKPMKMESSAFSQHGEIPARFTCEGGNISPPLAWSELPKGTKSLALIVDDPDAPDPKAPKMTWVHWVLYNVPADTIGLPEGVKPENLPAGTRQGLNDWKRIGYGGPCPPIGQHRYFHKLYALDTVLPDLGQVGKSKLEQAMQGHILGKAEYVGVYQKR